MLGREVTSGKAPAGRSTGLPGRVDEFIQASGHLGGAGIPRREVGTRMLLRTYIIRRLLLVMPLVLGVMSITFLLISAMPVQQRLVSSFGQPPRHAIGGYEPTVPCSTLGINQSGNCPNPLYQRLTHELGLDRPLVVQWGIYMLNTLEFKWGYVDNDSAAVGFESIARGQTVTTVLAWFLPYTIELGLMALAMILAITFSVGRRAAQYRNRPFDQAARVLSFSGFAIPTFLLASLMLMGFVILVGASSGYISHTPWCPVGEITFAEFYGSWPQNGCFAGGQYPLWLTGSIVSHPTGFPTLDAALHGQGWLALDTLLRMFIPAFVIAYGSIAFLLRFVRNSMLEEMGLDYVRTARAIGLPERTVMKRHVGRNSLNVTITVLGLTLAGFFGGFPVLELVYHLNGVGLILAESLVAPFDFGLLFGSTLLFAFLTIFANLIVDVLYAILDPRVRLGS